jgi:hypothetical protein
MSAVASAVLLILIVALAWWLPPKRSWFIVMGLLWAFFLLLGIIISKRPLGILVNEQNVMSLSRFQTVLWTIIVISAFLVLGIARIKNGVLADEEGSQLGDPLNITIGNQLLALLGISAAALVGSPLVAATKKGKTPDPTAVQATADEMIRTGNVPESTKPPLSATTAASADGESLAEPAAPATPDSTQLAAEISNNASGTLYKNPSVGDASFTDIFEGNEVSNTAHVDLGKVQMFFFTVIVAIAYVAALWDVLSQGAIYDANFAFPVLSDGMVALLGISNASYLAAKGVNHT